MCAYVRDVIRADCRSGAGAVSLPVFVIGYLNRLQLFNDAVTTALGFNNNKYKYRYFIKKLQLYYRSHFLNMAYKCIIHYITSLRTVDSIEKR